MSTTIKDQIIEQVDRLDEAQRERLLEFARRIAASAGTPGRDLLRFAGTIDSADLEAISRAIQQGCEQVDPNAW